MQLSIFEYTMTKEENAILLDKAANICVSKHAGQRDKMGCAYFQHPMRVAMRCATDEEKMTALLHDTIEDTDVTPEYLLEEGFPETVVEAILSVTKRPGENYEDFVARAKQNPIGRVVKLHDLQDNLDVMRLDEVTAEMAVRFTKYLKAVRFLTSEDATSLPKPDMWIVENYSDKAFAVLGDTGLYAQVFMEHGGIFNPNLQGNPGWAFPKSRLKEVLKILESIR